VSLAALEAALAAAPDDPLVLAAYADCLSDAGDPRGEFHRLLMALDDPASGVDRKRAERELRRQWDANKAVWVPDTRPAVFKAGFYHLDGAVPLANIHYLLGFTPEKLAASPVWWMLRGVRVGTIRSYSAISDLYRRLGRSRVRTLRFAGPEYTYHVVRELLGSPLFTRLTELHMPGCGVTDDDAEALAAHAHTPRLKVLDLDRNHLSPIGHAALVAAGVHVSDRQYFMPGGWDFDPPAFPGDV
jgi:uncharacterized protein (TIGR02996 family)